MKFSTESLLSLVEKLKPIVLEAANAIMEVYVDESSFNTQLKADNSPLTKADLASNNIICSGLASITPDICIISEEKENLEYEERKNMKYLWTVDPLDGTKEFVKRNGEFTINIALLENGHPILGIVHIPATAKFYYGIKNHGAFFEDKKLTVQEFSLKNKSIKVVASRSYISPETQEIIDILDEPIVISKGSALKFLSIAENEASFYPRIGPTMEWDTAAAQIILEEAGGMVIDAKTLQPLSYNKPNLLNPDFIALAKISENIGVLYS
jgi:3'(2'), 5'-bisphosphate nucleotidase